MLRWVALAVWGVAMTVSRGSTLHPRTAGPVNATAPERIAALSRTGCEGSCPIYRVEVYADGAVDYEGILFVKVHGKVQDKLSPDALARLRRAFADSDYLNLRGRYDQGPPDAEFIDTFYRSGGRTHSVHHYAACPTVPAALSKLEERFDELVGSVRWVGTREERERLMESGAAP